MPEAADTLAPSEIKAGDTVGVAVFDGKGCLADADAGFARLLAPPPPGMPLDRWLRDHGLAFAPAATSLRARVAGRGGRAVELILARLPDCQVIVTATPGRIDDEVAFGAIDGATEWFWEMDADLRFSFVSDRFRIITGVDAAAVLGRSRAEFAGPPPTAEDAEKLRQHFVQLDKREPFRNFIYTSTLRNGEPVFFRISGDPVFTRDGQFLGYRGVGTVISETVAVREILEDVPIPLVVWRLSDGAVLHVNALAAERLGVPRKVPAGLSAADFFAAGSDLRRLMQAGGDTLVEVAMRDAAGTAFWAQLSARAIIFGGCRAVLVGLQDTTARRQAEETVAEQLHFQEVLLDSIPSPVFYKRRDGVYLGCNKAFSNYLGLERHDIIGHTAADVAPPELAQRYLAADEALYRNMHVQIYEGAVRSISGESRQVIFYKAPFFRRDGSVGGLVGTMLDITDQKLLEEALRSRSNDLRTILERGPIGVMITARDGDEVLFANARCGEILESPKLALIGGGLADHFADQQARAELMEALAQDGRVRDRELLMRRGGGSFWALVSADEILFDSHSALLFWIYDISVRRAVEDEYHKLFLAVEHSPTSVVITDALGRIEYVNPRFCEITGYTAVEAIGKTPRVCRSGQTPPQVYKDLWATIRAGRIWQGELLNRRKDGSLYWEGIHIAPITRGDGAITHFVAVKSDVTASKRAEHAIIEAKERAEDAARAKSEFLAMMSHEIRTPMNGILGMIQLLRDTPLDATQTDYLHTAQVSGEALLGILNDILDFSKLEARQLTLDVVPFDLRGLVSGTGDLMRSRAEEKGLRMATRLSGAVPTHVRGDPARLRQVLLNLLSNAIKFTDAGEIRLEVDAEPVGEDAALLRFVVADTGIGIPAEARPRLFSEFAQADSTIARRFGGTGLGLAICKKIVTLMRGAIGVDSTPGTGSTFWFEVALPLGTAEESAANKSARNESVQGRADMRSLNILLAEDNPVNQKVATALLAKQGHKVTVAKDGFEAVAAVADGAFDVVLMDVQMPGLDGFEATRRIRESGDKGRLPIIAMTANALKGDEQRCLDAGMDDYVAKPIHPQALYAALDRQLGDGGGVAIEADRLRRLEEQVGTDTLVELLHDFEATAPRYLADLKAAAAVQDVSAARNAAHDIKALSATFGVVALTDLALAAETAAREGRGADAFAQVEALEAALNDGIAALRRMYPKAFA